MTDNQPDKGRYDWEDGDVIIEPGKRARPLMRAVAEVVVNEEKARAAADLELAGDLAQLRERLDTIAKTTVLPERGEKGEPGLVGPPGEKGDRGEPGRDANLMVPPELADRVASAVRVLHEAPPLIEPASATAKVIRIERDGNGALVPVYE
jgi:hypothetical protein